MSNDYELNEIWQKYERGRDYLNRKGLVASTDTYWDMYHGFQWRGLKSGGEQMPVDNFIKPTVKYKVSTVAQNTLVAVFSDLDRTEDHDDICRLLDIDFAKTWEKGRFDVLKWEIIKAAAVAGDSYLYFGTDDASDAQIIANTEIMFGNENESDIQKQPYILIYERALVSEIKKRAKANGVEQSLVDLISGDSETQYQIGNREEVRESDKCTSIIYFSKDENGYITTGRAVKECVYEPIHSLTVERGGEVVSGARLYPIVSLIWEKMPNSARGNSEVRQLMPNQIEHNKTLARRSMSVKMTAFPRIAYDATAIQNEEDLTTVGAAIAMQGASSNVDQMIKYLNPASMSHDAESLQNDLMEVTMELAGAGNSALGNIDPSRVSGTAMEVIRDQAAAPLNEQVSAFRQWAEDVAHLRYDMLCAYAPEEGVTVRYTDELGEEQEGHIPSSTLEEFRPNVRIDISPDNAWSKYAEQQELTNLLSAGLITLDEYIEILPANSNLPVNKLKKVLERRKQNAGNESEEGNESTDASQGIPMQEVQPGFSEPDGISSTYLEV